MEAAVGCLMSHSACPCESICTDGKGSNVCYAYAVIVHVVEGQDQREEGKGLMNAGTVGEQVRDGERYFSPSLANPPPPPTRAQCREVTSSTAIWRECHTTLPRSLPQTQMKFYFLCHAVERKQFFPFWLMSAIWAVHEYTRRHWRKDRCAFMCSFSLICHMY